MSKGVPTISDVQKRIANTSIGASTFRGQKKGSVQKAREYLQELDLTGLESLSEGEFARWLNGRTEELRQRLPGHEWGVARKAMNVFLENAFYDKFLSQRYNLDALETVLELPLDSNVAKGLRRDLDPHHDLTMLPKWDTIRRLSPEASKRFQDCAQVIADRERTSRIYLDLKYWRRENSDPSSGI